MNIKFITGMTVATSAIFGILYNTERLDVDRLEKEKLSYLKVNTEKITLGNQLKRLITENGRLKSDLKSHQAAVVNMAKVVKQPIDSPEPDATKIKENVDRLEQAVNLMKVLRSGLNEIDSADFEKQHAVLSKLSVGQVLGLGYAFPELKQLSKDHFDRRLLTASKEIVKKYSSDIEQNGFKINRVLRRGDFNGSTNGRGGGAYFSFTTETNDYNKTPQIELQLGRLSSGFYGGSKGFFYKLKELPVSLEGLPSDVPDFFYIEDGKQFRNDRDLRKESANYTRAYRRDKVTVGDTFLLKSYMPSEANILVVFQVIEVDDDEKGVTLLWKIIKDYGIPPR